jgi:putative DNA primase/helicase
MVIGDPVSLYLESRGCPLPENRDCLRFLASCPVPFEAGMRPAMLASVKGPDGKGVTLHRTFLRPDGSGKADMENARALMPGSLTPGSAVRLGPIEENMGIAEGLETALAARERFGIPFWAALNSANLAKWRPPQGVKRVLVCGDNDRKFGGQAAAYACAHGIAVMKEAPIVEVAIPDRSGMDWADFRSSEFVEAA